MNERQEVAIDNKDANYDGARRIISGLAWSIYLICMFMILIGVIVVVYSLSGQNPDPSLGLVLIISALGWLICTYVMLKLIDAIFELVKNTRQIRDELQRARQN